MSCLLLWFANFYFRNCLPLMFRSYFIFSVIQCAGGITLFVRLWFPDTHLDFIVSKLILLYNSVWLLTFLFTDFIFSWNQLQCYQLLVESSKLQTTWHKVFICLIFSKERLFHLSAWFIGLAIGFWIFRLMMQAGLIFNCFIS